MKIPKPLIIGIFIVAFIILLTPHRNPNWQEEYKMALETNNIPEEYTEETRVYDFSDEELQGIINDINSKSNNEEDAIRKAIRYMQQTMSYDSRASCEENRGASDILNFQYGHCVTMSKIDIALLRGLGFAARPVGGCLNTKNYCQPVLALMPFEEPKHPDVFDPTSDKRRGFLHQWVQVWTTKQGWVNVEATTGTVYADDCGLYTISDYTMSCSEKDKEFIEVCNGK